MTKNALRTVTSMTSMASSSPAHMTNTLSKKQKDIAKNYLDRFAKASYVQNFEHLMSQHTPNTPISLRLHTVESPLSSPSLYLSLLRNALVRQQVSPTPSVLKDYVHLNDPKGKTYRAGELQTAKLHVLHSTQADLNRQLQRLQSLHARYPRDQHITQQLATVQQQLDVTKLVVSSAAPGASGSAAGGDSMIPVDAAPSAKVADRRLKGMFLMIKGASRGAMATKTFRHVGATETESTDMRMWEECKEQWPTKVGVYGLNMKVVYGNRVEFANEGWKDADGQALFTVQTPSSQHLVPIKSSLQQ